MTSTRWLAIVTAAQSVMWLYLMVSRDGLMAYAWMSFFAIPLAVWILLRFISLARKLLTQASGEGEPGKGVETMVCAIVLIVQVALVLLTANGQA